MEAIASSDTLHVTELVKSCVVLSEKTPVALNCWVVPSAMLGFAGLTSMDKRTGSSPPPQPHPARRAESRSAKKHVMIGFFIASPFFFFFANYAADGIEEHAADE